MISEILFNTDSGNGVVPDGTNPLPEPILTYLHWGPVTISCGEFTEINLQIFYQNIQSNFSEANELIP